MAAKQSFIKIEFKPKNEAIDRAEQCYKACKPIVDAAKDAFNKGLKEKTTKIKNSEEDK